MAQTIATVAAIVLGGILVLRILVVLPASIRRRRRPEQRAIRLIGVGGGGSNAIDHMVAAGIAGVSFTACNTDAQALRRSAAMRLRFGDATTHGLGSGGDPEIGRKAAEEDERRIAGAVAGADLVFITVCLGGGTGSGAAPVFGTAARAQGALTIAVVTTPFAFEGAQRRRIADAAEAELATTVDAIITIPNDRVGGVLAEDGSMLDAFGVVNDVLRQAVVGLIDLLHRPGLINVDFADVRAVMREVGPALIGLGRGSGERRAIDAARQAMASPLLDADIEGARAVLFNIAGPPDLSLREVQAAADEIRANADPDANIIFGSSFDQPPGADVLVTLVATGLRGRKAVEPASVVGREPVVAEVRATAPDTTVSRSHGGSTSGHVEVASAVKRKSRRSVEPPAATEAEPAARGVEPVATEAEPAARAVEPVATEAEPAAAPEAEPAAAPEAEPAAAQGVERRAATEAEPAAQGVERRAATEAEPAVRAGVDGTDYEVASILRRRRPPASAR